MDTIFALSSGAPPAGIAVVRVSGPHARGAISALAGTVPAARRAVTRVLRDGDGGELDRALVLYLPGPGTATGEDVAEFHLHGGRAVVNAVERALADLAFTRQAEPGEFTRRAFSNGRIDLAEAEGLADLLAAETELQRRSAIAMAGGTLSRQVTAWRDTVLMLSARIEAALDFGDEDDVEQVPTAFYDDVSALVAVLSQWLARPRAETLRDGFRVVLAGPPNAGKSTLFNALVDSDAAITAPTAGTTRDVLERPVAIGGVPFTFVDTAGLHEGTGDAIEAIGIERAHLQVARADLVLWLGPEGAGPPGAWEIDAKCDLSATQGKHAARHRISALTGQGIDELRHALIGVALGKMPKPGETTLNRRQHDLTTSAHEALTAIVRHEDLLLTAEKLRMARVAFDRLIGRSSTEDMLDALFGRFCIGK